MYTGLMEVYVPKIFSCPRMKMAMHTSSRLALPARSPMPLMVHSTCRAPLATPARELAVDSPRSFWQCVEITNCPGTLALMPAMSSPNSVGRQMPTVSGMLSVVAPASTTAVRIRCRKMGSERPASSGLNSTSTQPSDRAYVTASTAIFTTSSGVLRSLNSMWMGDVAMKVWMRGRRACLTPSHDASMSRLLARDSPQITGT
mmetsp:Transcript_12663/g.30560  ORF Transcript_12663/g.30560 Transcript_12663/m.30560 type:complete len:202 (+) Transcript_12663:1229-1834(+)